MTDYTVPTGTAGSLIIRDHGSTVEYIITCGDSQTQVGQLGWNGTINGVNVGGTVSFAKGAGAIQVGVWNVTVDQTCLFNMFGTGTQGLGGPTSHSAHLVRAPASTVPAQMGPPTADQITATGMRLRWALPANGGAALDGILLRRYPTSETSDSTPFVTYVLGPAATEHTVTDLLRATPYWWVNYAHNVNGYSLKSPATLARTLGGVYQSNGTVWTDVPLDVSDGVTWRPGAVAVSDGTVWEDAL